MQRIATLLQKLTELSTQARPSQIDIDLMLDYTRVIYADLLDERKKLVADNYAPTRSMHETVPAVPRPVSHVAPVEVPAVAPASLEETPKEEKPLQPDAVIDTIVTQPEHTTPEPEPTPAPAPMHAPVHSSVPDHDIRTMIGINDKYLFISDLFKDDKAEYEHVIKHLNSLGNATAAEKWLNEEVASKHNWDKEQQTVQDFYALVNSFFPSK